MVKFECNNKIYGIVFLFLVPLVLSGCPQDPNCSTQDWWGSADANNGNQCQNIGDSDAGNSFEKTGRISVPFGFGFVTPTSMAVQSDGKILIGAGTGAPLSKPILVRYKSNGNIDSSFGSKGNVVVDVGNDAYFNGVAVQADGKIVATGHSYNFESIMVRFNSDGSLDSSFHTINMSGGNNQGMSSPTIQADGKILALNQHNIFRFNSDGSIDNSFASAGRDNTYVHTIALQSDQKIIACGETNYVSWPGYQYTYLSGAMPTVVRLNANGSPDITFGNSSIVPPMMLGASPCSAIAIQKDGKILIGGNIHFLNQSIRDSSDRKWVYVVRLNSDGSLDSSFAEDGILLYSMSKDSEIFGVSSIVVLPNNQIFVAGIYSTFRLNSDGSIDSSYVSPSSENGLATSALTPKGDIVMWGGVGYIYLIPQ